MTNVSSVLSYAIKKIWHGVAILLVTLAVLISLFRYALPHANNHKQFAQQYVAEKYGIDLQIGNIAATWRGAGPSIILTEVSLTQSEASPVNFTVDQVLVDINFWQSLHQGILISERFDIRGANLEVLPEHLNTTNQTSFPIVDALKNVFLIQLQRFNITDGKLLVKTHSQQELYEVDSVAWYNEGEHHQGIGNIRVSELATNSASFIVELTGDVDTLSGTFFAKADDLDVSPWLNEWLTTQYALEQSKANISAWLSVNNNTFDQLHIELGGSSLLWATGKEKESLTEFNSGTIQARPDDTGWAFRVDQLVISQNGSTFVTDLIGHTDYQGNALINTVKPIALAPVSSVFALFTGDGFMQQLEHLNVTGELATLQVRWQAQQPSVRAKFLDIAWQNYANTPGLNSLDLDLNWHDSQGHLSVQAADAAVDMTSINGTILENVAVNSDIYLYASQDPLTPGWSLAIPTLAVTSDQLGLSAQISHHFSSQFSQIALNLEELSLNQISDLLPASVMHENTIAFLTRALSGKGEVTNANLVMSGNVNQFPFAENQGIFQAAVTMQEADFIFSPKWPAITHIDGELLFENMSLHLQSSSAYIDEVELAAVNGIIPELRSSSDIRISFEGRGTGDSATRLIEKSSLTKLSDILNKNVLIDGDLTADITVVAPLKKGKNTIKANGDVYFDDVNINVPAIKVALRNANGKLHFEDSAISAQKLQGELYGQEIEVSLQGVQQSRDYKLDLGLAGTWDMVKTFEHFKLPLTESINGEFAWTGTATSLLSETDVDYELQLSSDLQGVDTRLPGPLFKTKEDISPLKIQAIGDIANSNISLSLGYDIKFSGVLDHKPLTFTNSLLTFGKTGNFIPTEDHAVLVSLPTIEFQPWNDLVQSINSHYADRPTRDIPLMHLPERVYVESQLMYVNSQTLENVRLSALQENKLWRIELNSKQALAMSVIPANWQQDGITVFAEKLHLTIPKKATDNIQQTSNQFDIKFPLRLRCDDCRLNDIEIGKVDLELNPETSGVFIDRLNINSPNASLIASGRWDITDNASTYLNGQLKSNDFGRWLDSLGLSSGIKDSEADVEFALNWAGSPVDFRLNALSGKMNWELTDGYLTQLSDRGSRIFTLFSFDSLVRKLSLDFRDVFAQGFFYNDISGTFDIENGKANTLDTLIDGAAGDIEITGYSQLDKQELNYNVSFTPNVTGNLPFLVYFLVNPPTALAALALDQVLTSAKVISNINYHVTGSFSEPILTEVNRNSKDVTLPAQQNPESQEDLTPLNQDDLQKVKVKVVDG